MDNERRGGFVVGGQQVGHGNDRGFWGQAEVEQMEYARPLPPRQQEEDDWMEYVSDDDIDGYFEVEMFKAIFDLMKDRLMLTAKEHEAIKESIKPEKHWKDTIEVIQQAMRDEL